MHTKDSALEALRRATRGFLALVEGVAEDAWRVRPAGQEWSIAETVEHVVLANRAVLGRLERLLDAPLAAAAARYEDAAISDDMFRNAGPAPPGLGDPTGRFATRTEGVAALTAACDGIAAWTSAQREDLRGHGLLHPVFGTFDGVQWILFAAAHTDNHVPQLRALSDLAQAR